MPAGSERWLQLLPNKLFMIEVTPVATMAITKPIAAYRMVFLPCENFSGSPADVVIWKAPTSTMIAVSGIAMVVEMKKITLFATEAKVSPPPSGSLSAIVALLNASADAAPVAKDHHARPSRVQLFRDLHHYFYYSRLLGVGNGRRGAEIERECQASIVCAVYHVRRRSTGRAHNVLSEPTPSWLMNAASRRRLSSSSELVATARSMLKLLPSR